MFEYNVSMWIPLSCAYFDASLNNLEISRPDAIRASSWGFRRGDGGPHLSRSLMLEDMRWAIHATEGTAGSLADFREAILTENCLGKRTQSARSSAFGRLRQLYGLDTQLPLFDVFRKLYLHDGTEPHARANLCLMLATARDPLLRASVLPVLGTTVGNEVDREKVRYALTPLCPDDSSAQRATGNVLSSWTAAGHLKGRGQKTRVAAPINKESVAFGLYLGFATGMSGPRLFETPWMALVGRQTDTVRLLDLAEEAHRVRLLTMCRSGGIMAIHFADDWPKQPLGEATGVESLNKQAQAPAPAPSP